MIGKGLLYTGIALISASALRGLMSLIQADRFDPWSVVLALGCILVSIGVGLAGLKPWEKIQTKVEGLFSDGG